MPIAGRLDPRALSEMCEGRVMTEGDMGEREACATYHGGVLRS